MKDTDDDDSKNQNPENESAKRVLGRLRVLLIILFLLFIATVIWFSVAPHS
jgi:hypothetical protein